MVNDTSAFDNLKQRSTWNFDFLSDTVNHDKIIAPFANILGDWSSDLVLKTVRKPRISNLKVEQQNIGGLDLDDAWVSSAVTDEYPALQKLLALFQMKNIRANIHVQKPGQMHIIHLDVNDASNKDEYQKECFTSIAKFFVMLDDWHAGQVIQLGNLVYTKWRKGDCVYYNWQDIPHGTANFGHVDRPILVVSGERTKDFDLLVDTPGITQLYL